MLIERLLFVIALLALTGGFVWSQGPSDPVYRESERFADAYNSWAKHVAHTSPYSPDYGANVAEKWYEERVGQRFRKLEAALKKAAK